MVMTLVKDQDHYRLPWCIAKQLILHNGFIHARKYHLVPLRALAIINEIMRLSFFSLKFNEKKIKDHISVYKQKCS